MSEKPEISSADLEAVEKKIIKSLDNMMATSNSVFLLMTIVIFLICALLIVQVAFSVFNLKSKPPPAQPTKVIVQKKRKRGSSSSKRSRRRRRGSKKSSHSSRTTRSANSEKRNFPSKTASVKIDFDSREKEKIEKKDTIIRAPSAQLPGYSSEKPGYARLSDTSGLESLNVTQKSSPLPAFNLPATHGTQPPKTSSNIWDPSGKPATPGPVQNPNQNAKPADAASQSSYNIFSQYLAHPIFGAGIKSERLDFSTPPEATTPKDVKKP